jgi:hypothetical protein
MLKKKMVVPPDISRRIEQAIRTNNGQVFASLDLPASVLFKLMKYRGNPSSPVFLIMRETTDAVYQEKKRLQGERDKALNLEVQSLVGMQQAMGLPEPHKLLLVENFTAVRARSAQARLQSLRQGLQYVSKVFTLANGFTAPCGPVSVVTYIRSVARRCVPRAYSMERAETHVQDVYLNGLGSVYRHVMATTDDSTKSARAKSLLKCVPTAEVWTLEALSNSAKLFLDQVADETSLAAAAKGLGKTKAQATSILLDKSRAGDKERRALPMNMAGIIAKVLANANALAFLEAHSQSPNIPDRPAVLIIMRRVWGDARLRDVFTPLGEQALRQYAEAVVRLAQHRAQFEDFVVRQFGLTGDPLQELTADLDLASSFAATDGVLCVAHPAPGAQTAPMGREEQELLFVWGKHCEFEVKGLQEWQRRDRVVLAAESGHLARTILDRLAATRSLCFLGHVVAFSRTLNLRELPVRAMRTVLNRLWQDGIVPTPGPSTESQVAAEAALAAALLIFEQQMGANEEYVSDLVAVAKLFSEALSVQREWSPASLLVLNDFVGGEEEWIPLYRKVYVDLAIATQVFRQVDAAEPEPELPSSSVPPFEAPHSEQPEGPHSDTHTEPGLQTEPEAASAARAARAQKVVQVSTDLTALVAGYRSPRGTTEVYTNTAYKTILTTLLDTFSSLRSGRPTIEQGLLDLAHRFVVAKAEAEAKVPTDSADAEQAKANAATANAALVVGFHKQWWGLHDVDPFKTNESASTEYIQALFALVADSTTIKGLDHVVYTVFRDLNLDVGPIVRDATAAALLSVTPLTGVELAMAVPESKVRTALLQVLMTHPARKAAGVVLHGLRVSRVCSDAFHRVIGGMDGLVGGLSSDMADSKSLLGSLLKAVDEQSSVNERSVMDDRDAILDLLAPYASTDLGGPSKGQLSVQQFAEAVLLRSWEWDPVVQRALTESPTLWGLAVDLLNVLSEGSEESLTSLHEAMGPFDARWERTRRARLDEGGRLPSVVVFTLKTYATKILRTKRVVDATTGTLATMVARLWPAHADDPVRAMALSFADADPMRQEFREDRDLKDHVLARCQEVLATAAVADLPKDMTALLEDLQRFAVPYSLLVVVMRKAEVHVGVPWHALDTVACSQSIASAVLWWARQDPAYARGPVAEVLTAARDLIWSTSDADPTKLAALDPNPRPDAPPLTSPLDKLTWVATQRRHRRKHIRQPGRVDTPGSPRKLPKGRRPPPDAGVKRDLDPDTAKAVRGMLVFKDVHDLQHALDTMTVEDPLETRQRELEFRVLQRQRKVSKLQRQLQTLHAHREDLLRLSRGGTRYGPLATTQLQKLHDAITKIQDQLVRLQPPES